VRRPDPRVPESWCREGVSHDHGACGSLWDSTDQREIEEATRWADAQAEPPVVRDVAIDHRPTVQKGRRQAMTTTYRIGRAERLFYVLGLPAAARLVRCVDAARDKRRRDAAIVAGGFAVAALLIALAAAGALLCGGWAALHHEDFTWFVGAFVVLSVVATVSGGLAELPNLERPLTHPGPPAPVSTSRRDGSA
jgi:hypothetical protein